MGYIEHTGTLSAPPIGHRTEQRDCPECATYRARVGELEGEIARERRHLLATNTRNQIRLRTATERTARALPPVNDPG